MLVSLPANSTLDHANNGNEASNQLEIEFDNTALTVDLSTTASSPTNNSFEVAISFSDAVADFVATDLTTTNGTVSDFSGGGASYVATITPEADGEVVVTIAEGVASSEAGTSNEAASPLTVTFDGTAPTVVVTSDVASPTNSSFEVTITFDEAVTSFELADLLVNNGEASNLTGSGSVYTATISPTSDGEVSISVAENSALDAAGNGNAASNTFSATFDATSPTVVVASNVASPTNGPFDITIDFSEEVTGFSLSAIIASNANISNLRGEGSSYSATITPTTSGTVTASVAAGSANDTAGNSNEASNVLSVDFDNSLVTSSITTMAGSPTNGAFDASINFDVTVSGFELNDLQVTNGVASNLTGSGASYMVTITPEADGEVTVNLPAGAVTNDAGNGNAASSLSIVFDGTAPLFSSVNITSSNENSVATATVGDQITIALVSSEALADLPMVSIAGREAAVTNTGANSYEAQITVAETDDLGVVSFAIDFGDIAGNNGLQVTETTDESSVEIVTETVTSVGNLPDAVLTIFPNPVADIVNIELTDTTQADQVILYTFSGYEIRREAVDSHLTSINCNNLSAGIYLMALLKEGKVVAKKKIRIK